jgi:hypothetical protein
MQIRRPRPLLKKLRRLARDESIELWSMDECHFQQHGSRCRMWVPPEDKSLVRPFAIQNRQLLPQSQIFKGQLSTILE